MRSRNLKLLYALMISAACLPITHRVLAYATHDRASTAATSPDAGAATERVEPFVFDPAPKVSKAAAAANARTAAALDHSGHTRTGRASFYANRFGGRKMADGTPMDLRGDNAASRTLPLGTRARITNLENGRSAVVTIRDRGPYVDGRIVDLSPATAQDIGLTREQGITRVAVAPISVPLPDGRTRSGDGADRTANVN